MIRARVLRVNEGRGFGIARPLDGGDTIIVHFSVLADRQELVPGGLLDLEYEYRAGRPRAVYAQVVQLVEPTKPGPRPLVCDDPDSVCDDPNCVVS